MPPVFPGMNPYLEDPSIWEDFHQNLATEIQTRLAPKLRPKYFAAIVPRVTYEEVFIEERHSIKPDVSIYQVNERALSDATVAVAPAPLLGQATLELPIKLFSVEIRETATGILITAIEILSPVNKKPGHQAYDEYHRKRRDLFRSSAHLLEIDLLRAGKRLPLVTPLPEVPYFIFLSRETRRPQIEIWPLRLQDSIPILPVPLKAPDPDVPLDLGGAIQAIYDRAAYDLRIDYTPPPPKPDLTSDDLAWLEAHLQTAGVR